MPPEQFKTVTLPLATCDLIQKFKEEHHFKSSAEAIFVAVNLAKTIMKKEIEL